MYPRLSDLFYDLFGLELPLPIYSFGAMVAAAILTAAWVTRAELDRMLAEGRIGMVRVKAQGKAPVGKAARRATEPAPPSALVGTLTVLALVSGFAGAKVFHILENLDDFLRAPLSMLFSSGGFTFYGGLLTAAAALARHVRRHGLRPWAFGDAVAPSLILGYGIGRIGCHLAGDGDWGIASNLALKPEWLPVWLWAETYPRNILNVVIPPPGVYPTPLYEFAMCLALFGLLWALRRHPFRDGWLFAAYLVCAGAERMLIEQIRVNNLFLVAGFEVTQAEIISALLILAGLVGLAVASRRRAVPAEAATARRP